MVPRNVDGSDPNNVLTKRRRVFEDACVALKTNGIADPKNLSIFEFFSTLDHFEQKRKQRKP